VKNILILCLLVGAVLRELGSQRLRERFPDCCLKSRDPVHHPAAVSPILLLDKRPGKGIYRPLTVLSLSVDYAFGSLAAVSFMNLLIHALNGWLLFR
jgi:hypothetical protein